MTQAYAVYRTNDLATFPPTYAVRAGWLKDYPNESGLMRRQDRFTPNLSDDLPPKPMRVYLNRGAAENYIR